MKSVQKEYTERKISSWNYGSCQHSYVDTEGRLWGDWVGVTSEAESKLEKFGKGGDKLKSKWRKCLKVEEVMHCVKWDW